VKKSAADGLEGPAIRHGLQTRVYPQIRPAFVRSEVVRIG